MLSTTAKKLGEGAGRRARASTKATCRAAAARLVGKVQKPICHLSAINFTLDKVNKKNLYRYQIDMANICYDFCPRYLLNMNFDAY